GCVAWCSMSRTARRSLTRCSPSAISRMPACGLVSASRRWMAASRSTTKIRCHMLEGRLLTGDAREYAHADWDGANHSGCHPLDDKVLVLMDEHVEQTAGRVYLPQNYRERQTLASETGVVVALGEAAFTFNDDGN